MNPLNKPLDPLSKILMDTARDLMLAQMAGRSLAPVEAEAAARISAHYQPKPICAECDQPIHGEVYCGRHKWCFAEAKGYDNADGAE